MRGFFVDLLIYKIYVSLFVKIFYFGEILHGLFLQTRAFYLLTSIIVAVLVSYTILP